MLLFEVRERERVGDVEISRGELQSNLKLGGCAVELAEHEIDLADEMVPVSASWVGGDGPLQRIDRLLVLRRIEIRRRLIDQNRLGSSPAGSRAVERLDGLLILSFREQNFTQVAVRFAERGAVFGFGLNKLARRVQV